MRNLLKYEDKGYIEILIDEKVELNYDFEGGELDSFILTDLEPSELAEFLEIEDLVEDLEESKEESEFEDSMFRYIYRLEENTMTDELTTEEEQKELFEFWDSMEEGE